MMLEPRRMELATEYDISNRPYICEFSFICDFFEIYGKFC